MPEQRPSFTTEIVKCLLQIKWCCWYFFLFAFSLTRQEALTWKYIKPLWRLFPAPAVWIVVYSVRRSSEEMELCAQMGAHTAPPRNETTVELCVRVHARVACTAEPLRLHSSRSVFRYGRSYVHVPNLRACVCLCGRAQLDTDCWHWLGDSLNTRLCWRVGVPPRLPLLWRMNINNSKAISISAASEAVSHYPGMSWYCCCMKGHRQAKRQEEENCDAPLKRQPCGFCYQINWGEKRTLLREDF